MPTSKHLAIKQRKQRVHQSHATILVILDAGKIDEVLFYKSIGQVLVADKEALAGLATPEEREAAIMLGFGSLTVGHAAIEYAIEELVNPPAPIPAPPEPLTATEEAALVVEDVPAVEPTPVPSTVITDAATAVVVPAVATFTMIPSDVIPPVIVPVVTGEPAV